MDDFERRLAIAVKSASPEPPTEIDAEQITRTRPGRRRAAVLAPVAAAVAVGATAVAVITLTHSHASHRAAGTGAPSAVSTAARSAATTAAPAVPPPPDGFSAVEFRMAPPAQEVMGPVDIPRPTCNPAQITATAATRSSSGGVLGVIRLRGAVVKHHDGYPLRCTLPVAQGPTALVGADRRRLHVPLALGDRTDPPQNPRSDLPLNGGDAIWGFAWLGSYCGPAATAIEIRAAGQTVRAPLHGPRPSCGSAGNTSSLIDGIAGRPGEPVQPPRPEYSRLRLTGRIQPGTTHTRLAPIELTVRATGTAPITLDPCPRYAGRDEATAHSGGFSDPIGAGYLPCVNRVVVIRPGTPLHFTVPGASLEQTPGTGAIPGSTVHVSIGIAGVPGLRLETTAH
jgi:hypothetical protein